MVSARFVVHWERHWMHWKHFADKVQRLLPATVNDEIDIQRRISFEPGGFERFLEIDVQFTDEECRALIAHSALLEDQLFTLLDHPRPGVRAGLLHHDNASVLFIMQSDQVANKVTRYLAEHDFWLLAPTPPAS